MVVETAVVTSEGVDIPSLAEEEEMEGSEEVVELLRWEPVSAAWRRSIGERLVMSDEG